MGKFLKPGKVVICLAGKYAGKKAVIVKTYDDGQTGRSYGHALVVGLSKPPRKVTKGATEKVQARRMKLKTFIKVVNFRHLMPTRYSLDEEALKNIATMDVVTAAKEATGKGKMTATARVQANKEAKKVLEAKFKTGKQRWFFTKLRF